MVRDGRSPNQYHPTRADIEDPQRLAKLIDHLFQRTQILGTRIDVVKTTSYERISEAQAAQIRQLISANASEPLSLDGLVGEAETAQKGRVVLIEGSTLPDVKLGWAEGQLIRLLGTNTNYFFDTTISPAPGGWTAF